MGCNRKTVGKLIDNFNRLGIQPPEQQPHFRSYPALSHRLVFGGVLITNPHYVRPPATTQGQTGDVRAPLSYDLPLKSSQSIVPSDRQSKMRTAQQPFFLLSVFIFQHYPGVVEAAAPVCLPLPQMPHVVQSPMPKLAKRVALPNRRKTVGGIRLPRKNFRGIRARPNQSSFGKCRTLTMKPIIETISMKMSQTMSREKQKI